MTRSLTVGMVLTVRFFFRLTKRLWTRFGNSIRHMWHEKCRCNSNRPYYRFTHANTYTRALFEQKELTYLFICPPPPVYVYRSTTFATTAHCILVFTVRQQQHIIPFCSFLAYRHPPPSINIVTHSSIMVDKRIVYLSHDFEPSDQTRLFLAKTYSHFQFS